MAVPTAFAAPRGPLSESMMTPLLYLGDTTLSTAASYLGGVLANAGLRFDYVPSDQALSAQQISAGRPLVILSDYPAARISTSVQERIVSAVADGMGLLMIGGWESFHGLGGDWDGTPVGRILPVEVSGSDDRLNCDHPVLIRCVAPAHDITEGLPWETRPPVIGGMNKVVAKPLGSVLLEACHYAADWYRGELRLHAAGRDPLLVVGTHGAGRVACLMTDAAPHWVGPFVDWGATRVSAKGPGAGEIEVGSLYAQFFQQLVRWTMGK